MSYQAMEAVQDHSQYTDNTPENFAPFKIMLAIARNADRHGVTGTAGNYRQCLSYRGIARIANVHRNTVGTWIPKLIESGELTTESGGSGRASWTVYYIQLPIDNAIRGDNTATMAQGTAQTTAQGMAQAIETMAQALAQHTDLLAQALAQGVPTMAQHNGTNGTSPPSNSCHIQDTLIQDETEIQPETAGDAPDPGDDFDWPLIQSALKNQLAKATYDAHFRQATAVLRDGCAIIDCPTQNSADWINGRLQPTIAAVIEGYTGRVIPVFARQRPLKERQLA